MEADVWRRPGTGRFTVAAGDQAAVLKCIARAKARCALAASASVHSCYEAGRDGWWLHRWLKQQGIDNIVVDSSSIEVTGMRGAPRAIGSTATSCCRCCCATGAASACGRSLHEPSVQAEDERRMHRELQRLTREHTAHCNRIRALLVLHNLRPRTWAASLDGMVVGASGAGPSLLRAEIERECHRLELVRSRCARSRRSSATAGTTTVIKQLSSCAHRHAWRLGARKELFGWRQFDNRRSSPALGLVPRVRSGDSVREQGSANRATNACVGCWWSWRGAG